MPRRGYGWGLMLAGLWCVVLSGSPRQIGAQNVLNPLEALAAAPAEDGGEDAAAPGWDEFFEKWKQLGDFPVLAGLFLAFVLATALSAVVAYHPRSYGKARTLAEVESPKTYIMYALVGAVCGQIVLIDNVLGFVLFGLGGLMRFRTDVGAAKDTGRVILVTCIGLCCGLQRYDIAVTSTAFAYVLIAGLEGGAAYKITIKGLGKDAVAKSAAAYRHLFNEQGCRILNEKKNFVKHQVVFVFRAPRGIDREDLDQLFEEGISPELKGAVDWQSS